MTVKVTVALELPRLEPLLQFEYVSSADPE
jgi:hypothetical protein